MDSPNYSTLEFDMGKKAKKSKGVSGFAPPENPERPTPDEFAVMVEAHDPTYVWSRNPAERMRGAAERAHIDAARARMGDALCVPLWNRSVYRKVVPSMAQEFVWNHRERPRTA